MPSDYHRAVAHLQLGVADAGPEVPREALAEAERGAEPVHRPPDVFVDEDGDDAGPRCRRLSTMAPPIAS
jgi:hypothetical protein